MRQFRSNEPPTDANLTRAAHHAHVSTGATRTGHRRGKRGSRVGSFERAYDGNETWVRLTALSLTCAARARVAMPRGAAAAAHTAGQQRVICSRRDTVLVLFGRGASAPDRSRAATGSAMS